LISCKDQTNPTLTSNVVFPSSGVSFSKQVEPLFMQTCVAAGCHGINQPAANLNLETDVWHSLIDYVPPIVSVKNGNNSPLVKYLDGRLAPQMPLRQPALTTNQINGIKTWINEGAQNN
jgi:mono/diheme cytochrome c family protein